MTHLQFGENGRRRPGDAHAAEGVGEHVGQDGRVGGGAGEIGVKLRGVPVEHSRHDDSLDVGHHLKTRAERTSAVRSESDGIHAGTNQTITLTRHC